jgi:transcriptional regulator with XRE-family HTH domain
MKQWLSQHLEPLSWSAADLSRASGIPVETVSKYLEGDKPTKEDLLKIAKALHLAPESLFRQAGVPYQKPGAWKKKIILLFGALILAFTAFTGGLLLGATANRSDEMQATATSPFATAPADSKQPSLGLEASQPAPMRAHRDDTTIRTGAWEQIEAATLCKSPSPESVVILIDPFDALAEIWVMTCPNGDMESYRVVYTPTVSGTTAIVTKMARP